MGSDSYNHHHHHTPPPSHTTTITQHHPEGQKTPILLFSLNGYLAIHHHKGTGVLPAIAGRSLAPPPPTTPPTPAQTEITGAYFPSCFCRSTQAPTPIPNPTPIPTPHHTTPHHTPPHRAPSYPDEHRVKSKCSIF